MSKRTKRKGSSKPRKSKVLSGAAAKRAKYADLEKVLATADAKTLASLLNTLQTGNRNVHPGVTLSSFEAGFLAAQLRSGLKPKRRRRKKIDLDHILYSLT
jgi:hypothetical protein